MAWVHTVKENNLDLQISTYYLERITYTKVLGVIMQVGTKRTLFCLLKVKNVTDSSLCRVLQRLNSYQAYGPQRNF